MHDDRRIIELLNQRDEQVLQIIQKQYGAFCYQVAFRIIGNREDAEECVNDMLMGVWNSIPPEFSRSPSCVSGCTRPQNRAAKK